MNYHSIIYKAKAFINKYFRLTVALLLLISVTTPAAAETRTFIDDAGRSVEIPVKATRVISQNDNRLTLPLLELGVPLVGSSGRVDSEGNTYMRSVPDLLGIDFDSADFEFIGTFNDLDYEKIVSLKPDLIITMREDQVAQLSIIAPTLVINPNNYPVPEGMLRLAKATGYADSYERLSRAYARKLGIVKPLFDEIADLTVSVTFSFEAGENVYFYKDLGALTVVLNDLGIDLPKAAKALDKNSIAISRERWQDIDADFIINFFGTTAARSPSKIRAGLDKFLPGWCDFLHACKNDQVLFFPYASYGYSFGALGLNLDLLTTHIVGRDFTPLK